LIFAKNVLVVPERVTDNSAGSGVVGGVEPEERVKLIVPSWFS
jgi:hypothetical protein